MWRTVRDFAKEHRAKLIGAMIVGAGATAWYYYSDSESDGTENSIAVSSGLERGGVVRADSQSPARRRAKILLEVRKQFNSHALHFLPTLKLKIGEVVDINNAVRKIKEIRSNSSNSDILAKDSVDVEAKLWDEIKVSSLTILFVTVYMESIVCALLRIQLHVVAAYTMEMERDNKNNKQSSNSDGTDSSSSSSSSGENRIDDLDVNLLEKLITATYSRIYDAGLRNLAQLVRQGVTNEMQDWVVREKMNVQYDEFISKLCTLRTAFERDTPGLINVLAISPENTDPEMLCGSSTAGSKRSDHSTASSQGGSSGRKEGVVNELLCRTWDIVDSHVFQSIFNEAVNTVFRHVNQNLRDDVFSTNTSSSGSSGGSSANNASTGSQQLHQQQQQQQQQHYRTPPLASLLPQMKSIAARMLPSVHDGLTVEAREIAEGPILNALCEAVFDETCSM
jgi:hypothetical protein